MYSCSSSCVDILQKSNIGFIHTYCPQCLWYCFMVYGHTHTHTHMHTHTCMHISMRIHMCTYSANEIAFTHSSFSQKHRHTTTHTHTHTFILFCSFPHACKHATALVVSSDKDYFCSLQVSTHTAFAHGMNASTVVSLVVSLVSYSTPPGWPSGKVSAFREADLGSIPTFAVDLFPVVVIPVALKMVLLWLCRAPGILLFRVSAGVVGPVSVYCDWVRWQVWSATSASAWQHIQLSEQISPWDTLAGW